MKNKTLIILFVLLTNLTFSQGKSVKETIDYINSKAGKSFTVSVKKDTEMTIEIFKGGELYRTDFLILGTIDASKTTYSAEEKGIKIGRAHV